MNNLELYLLNKIKKSSGAAIIGGTIGILNGITEPAVVAAPQVINDSQEATV